MKKMLISVILSATLVAGTIMGCGTQVPQEQPGSDSSVADNNPSQEITITPNPDFNKSLIEFVEQNGFSQENYMVSPTSFRAALALAASGADNETKDQILAAMGFSSMEEVNAWYNSVNSSIDNFDSLLKEAKKDFKENKEWYGDDAKEPDGTFQMANSIWSNTDASGKLSKDYIKYVQKNYDAEAENVDSSHITNKVNSWINNKTKGLIPEISGNMSDVAVALVNTVYLRTSWLESFSNYSTTQDDFTTIDGSTVRKDFMQQTNSFKYYEDEKGKFVVLPMNGGINAVFILGEVDDIMDKLEDATYEEVDVKLPKFEIESSFSNNELIDYMVSQGATLPFTEDADFSVMSKDMSLVISDIIQKTKVKVDEDGIEAAAATAIMMKESAMEINEIKEFHADQPFKFMILTDSETPEPLFCGQLVK
ncbi:serpin B [Butyrivibrio hungatei DSM 14810]|uniref:Serpin B n=1 Tax=Butyrivibrio hungatei DSM 14810 TaxID=1121132 RepID=A0A1M7SSW4_9FIRM|nr:serpin family protein [Butyrivibrio hungatei]SHN61637.1 serpin B [Butyrivibrio hungatei DSM 14810]